mmetsp:Transcript_66739/g.184833  ORF Transcript_66739/g.184833 Transcript_66739/m.184833 type:complete len:303 (-) Transcript_66739:854-1762(-)
MALLAHVNVLDLLRVLGLRGVDKLLELLLHLLVVHHLLPLALELAHVVLDERLQVCADPEGVLDHHLLQVVQAARELLQPRRGALQVLGGGNVEHEEAVRVPQAGGLVDVCRQQLGVPRFRTPIATDVHVVARLGGDEAQVLSLGFRALAEASGARHLDFVRGAQALVALLQGDGHAHGVLLPIAAPRAAHAALHRAQGLSVGVPGLEARVHQVFPDGRELVHGGTVHAQALGTRDLRPQAVLLRHGADGDELVRRDVPARAPWDHGVGARLLDVRQEAVVRVLDLVAALLQHMLIPQARKD